jgi:Bacterial capsule synthesis protein PGA_cap
VSPSRLPKRPVGVLLALLALLLPPIVPLEAQLPDSAAPAVHLVFTGDINPGIRTEENGIPPDSGRAFFQQVDTLLRGDLVIGNFEGTLSDSGDSEKCKDKPADLCYAFATPTWLAARLVEAGFTHLNLANNHAGDFGPAGRRHTEEVFDSLGVETYGPLERIVMTPVWVDSTPVMVGVVGFTTYPFAYNLLDLARSRAVVDSVRRYVDLLVVTFHGGTEKGQPARVPRGAEQLAGEDRGDLRRWARVVIDAGADAVVGHGPHVLRGVEFYRGKPIFYSLGNFANYRGFSLDGPKAVSVVLDLAIAKGGTFEGARVIPIRQRPGVGPMPDPRGAGLQLLQRLTRLDFGKTGAIIRKDGEVLEPGPPAGLPHLGARASPAPDPAVTKADSAGGGGER